MVFYGMKSRISVWAAGALSVVLGDSSSLRCNIVHDLHNTCFYFTFVVLF